MLRSLLVSLLLVGACSAGAPPTASPAPTGAPTAVPTVAPTVAPTTAPTPTGTAYCNPDYDDCDKYSPSPGAETPAPVGDADVALSDDGTYLVGANGLALYVFDNDSAGESACDGGCADTWPPLGADEGETPTAGEGVSGTLTTFHRSDDSHQVAYNDRPLYFYSSDTEPGDTRGDGIGGVWHLATP